MTATVKQASLVGGVVTHTVLAQPFADIAAAVDHLKGHKAAKA